MTMVLFIVKGTIVLTLVLLVWLLLRRGAASTRRMVLAAGIIGVVLLPLFMAIMPSLDFKWLPVERIQTVAEVVLAPVDDAFSDDDLATGLELVETKGEEASATATTTAGAAPLRNVGSIAGVTSGEILLMVWLVGVVTLVFRLLFGLLWAGRIRRTCSRKVSPRWAAALEETSEDLRAVPHGVRLCFTKYVEVPTVAGIFRPTIFLPIEALTWGRSRRRVVLLHELAHVIHHDNLLSLIGQLLCAVHWFNPLAWWAVRCLSVESERAADDVVLEVGTKATDYASELLLIVRDRQLRFAAASTMAKPAELTSRVKWILDGRCRREGWSPGRRAAFWTSGIAALALLSCVGEVVSEAGGGEVSDSSDLDSTVVLARLVADAYGVSPDGVELTINQPLQGVVDAEVRTLVERYRPRSVSVVALDPCNGHVLALGGHGRGGLAASARAFEPGATLRPLTVAAAFEEGMSPDAVFFCENGSWRLGDRMIRDTTPAGWLDVGGVVARSSAIGTGRIYQEIGWDAFRSRLVTFGITERPRLDLPGVEGGVIPMVEGSTLRGVLASNGVGVRTSSIQIAAAYATVANGGTYHAPFLARQVRDEDGAVVSSHVPEERRVMSQATADSVLEMLESSVEGVGAVGGEARVDGVRIAGMTGTTQLETTDVGEGMTELEFSASFVGIVDPEEPQVVIVVGVEGLRGENVTGGQVAAPAFARIVSHAREVGARIE